MIVAYVNNKHILICDKKDEPKLIKDYFVNGGRNRNAYNRETTTKGSKFIDIDIKLDFSIEIPCSD